MTTRESLYDILGVSRDASQDDIKKAFKKLALRYHPDKNKDEPDAEKNFKQVNDAYSILSDPEKKQQYDQFGTVNDMPGMTDINDIFSQVFGHGGMGGFGGAGFPGMNPFSFMFGNNRPSGFQRQNNRPDIIRLEVNLTELYHGCVKKVEYTIIDNCTTCKGNGVQDIKDIIKCMSCDGKGHVCQKINPFMMTTSICNSCGGQGKMIKPGRECQSCKGQKQVNVTKTLEIKIPKGVQNGYCHKIDSKGSINLDTNTYCELNVVFVHKSNYNEQCIGVSECIIDDQHDVHITLDVKLEELLCGFQKAINIYGFNMLINTSGYVNPHKIFTIKGMGLPFHKKATGNLYVKLKVLYPEDATKITKYQDVFTKIFKYTQKLSEQTDHNYILNM